MKSQITLGLAVAVLASAAFAADLTSGLQPGRKLGPFNVVKCGGAEDDSVKVGDELCYRCKYGNRPMVMVFTRSANDELTKLVKELDQAVAKHEDAKLAAFVNLLGDDRDELESQAKSYAHKTSVKNVPIVVPVEYENGPEDYGLNPDAEVTIIVANKGEVKANKAYAKGEFKADEAKSILEEIKKTL